MHKSKAIVFALYLYAFDTPRCAHPPQEKLLFIEQIKERFFA